MSRLQRTALGVIFAPLLLLSTAWSAQSQTVYSVRGVVQELPSLTPVTGATVLLDGRLAVVTDERGQFRFTGVPAGSVLLTVEALGYLGAEMRINVTADTAVSIGLNLDPVLLQALRADAGLVSVRAELRERGTSTPVSNARILATQNRNTTARIDGWFQFRRVPVGVPFEMRILAFGYHSVQVALTPQRDTTMVLSLEIDTMVQRLIAQQVARLQERMTDAVGKSYAITRDELLRYHGEPLTRALQWLLLRAPFNPRATVQCTFVDEREVANDAPEFLLPEEIQRVEYLYHGTMLRIYTRRFMAQMVSTDLKLPPTGSAQPPAGFMGRAAQSAAFCT